MKYNFDEVIERRGTDSVKYDAVSERWGRSDLLPDVGGRYGFPYSSFCDRGYPSEIGS